ncbi:hypothetical protein ABZ234_03940 [Nocardiopsis sp. NPDC006198]|uniref:hypothetical protein n=1 Tax=Nocardiopsis sp. NPDC006198 TaxID=3154472 RepID=UPI0033BB9085
MKTAPREIRVTRYVCPHCSRGHAKQAAAVAHIGRCWRNPDNRGCKTCWNYDQDPEVDLPPQPRCFAGLLEIDALPVTGCPEWAPRYADEVPE